MVGFERSCAMKKTTHFYKIFELFNSCRLHRRTYYDKHLAADVKTTYCQYSLLKK